MSYAPLGLTIPLAAVLLLLALPSAITAQRGRTGGLARRGRLGVHTPAAVASDEAFSLANRVAAPLVAGAAGVATVCAVLVLALPLGVVGAIVVAVLGLAGLFGQLYAASTLGERAAATVPPPARRPQPGAGCCGGCGCGDGGCRGGSAAGAPAPSNPAGSAAGAPAASARPADTAHA